MGGLPTLLLLALRCAQVISIFLAVQILGGLIVFLAFAPDHFLSALVGLGFLPSLSLLGRGARTFHALFLSLIG